MAQHLDRMLTVPVGSQDNFTRLRASAQPPQRFNGIVHSVVPTEHASLLQWESSELPGKNALVIVAPWTGCGATAITLSSRRETEA